MVRRGRHTEGSRRSVYHACVWSQVPPFSGVLDWDLFSITIPTAKIPSLRRILRAANHTKLHANLRRVRRAFALRRAVFDGAAKPRPPRRQ